MAMEWNEKLQLIIDIVEHHLQLEEEPVNHEEIAKIAGCSFDFFQKVFSYMNGISFAEYVRFRKLTLAGYDLKSTNKKVLDISYQYGYASPTSFSKAFQQFHGFSPKEAREENKKLRVMPKMQIFQNQRYSWKLEKKDKFRLIGKSETFSLLSNDLSEKIPEFWSECQKNGVYSTLISLSTGIPDGLFGVFELPNEKTQEVEYAIMAISDQPLPLGFIEKDIPDATWAIFDCIGRVPQSIHKGWEYLEKEWLVTYPFKHAPCPELEWYCSKNHYRDDDLSQIWIPILEEEL